jgi:hypothetical protein
MSIGAAYYKQTPAYGVTPTVRESFSSRGNTLIYYDAQGNKYAQPQLNQKPDILAPDGTGNKHSHCMSNELLCTDVCEAHAPQSWCAR